MMRELLVLLGIALCACATPPATRAPTAERAAASSGGDAATAPATPPSSASPAAASPSTAPPEADGIQPVPRLDPASHLQAGQAALHQKNAPLAVAHLRACVDQEPSNGECLWELGWAHYLRNDWDSAIDAWQKVKSLTPEHPEVDGRLEDARNQQQLQRRLQQTAREAPPAVGAALPSGKSLRIRAVGDVMLGTDFPPGFLPPDDGGRMLAGVEDWLRDADITFGNLEGPLCDDPRPSDKCRRGGNCYAFRTPSRYVRHLLAAGVDLASTANNHSGDFGEACRRETETTLDRAGIRWSGPPGSVASIEARGLRVGLVAFHTSAATNDLNDHRAALALVRAAAAANDLVIVSFHGGAEGARSVHVPMGEETFYGENRGDLRKFTHLVVDAGADLVLGHGPHVLRGMEIYRERLIAYSLGNFATYGRFNLSGAMGVGAVLEAVLDAQGRFVSGRILPTRQVGEGVPEKDPAGTALQYVRLLSRDDFPESGVVVDAEGNIGPRPSASAAQAPR